MSGPSEEIKCPFCEKGIIKVRYTPRMLITKYGRASSNKKAMNYFKDERYAVFSDCPNCGKKTKEIEKFLNRGPDHKEPSNEEVVRRLREAGLDPTKLK